MNINNDQTVAELRKVFSNTFPGLKIEFYEKQHDSHEGSPISEQIAPGKKIGDIRSNQVDGNLVLTGDMTVAELEHRFETNFGLNVQVFRRSGDLWLQTSTTDSWTLKEQNRKGLHSIQ